MAIKVICPSCGRSGRVAESAAGRDGMCPACGASFRVPEAGAPAPRAIAPAPQAGPSPAEAAGAPAWMYAALAGGGGVLVLLGLVVALLLNRTEDEEPALPPIVAPTPAATGELPRITVTDPAPPPVPEGKTLSTAEIVARCEPSIALVQGKVSGGTGFLIRPGVLATNAHVIDDELIGNLEVRFPSAPEGKRGPYTADLLYEDKRRDLAFLAVGTGLYPLEVARHFRYVKGEDVVVIGNPGLANGAMVLENAVTRGVLSVKVQLDGQDFYQLGIAINHGNSGGPVLDSRGRVIGVATKKSTSEEALGFCIPLEDLAAALERLAAQPPGAALEARSRHRMPLVYKLLASAGAVYAVALDAHRQAWEQGALQTRAEDLGELRTTLAKLDGSLFANVGAEAGRVAQDPSYPEAVRRGVAQMFTGYDEMRATLRQVPNGSLDNFRFRAARLKQAHRHLVQELGRDLKVEVPERLLAALSDQAPAESVAALRESPAAGGPGSGPGLPAFREHFGIGPRIIITPPIPRYAPTIPRYAPTIPRHSPPSLRPRIGGPGIRSRFGR